LPKHLSFLKSFLEMMSKQQMAGQQYPVDVQLVRNILKEFDLIPTMKNAFDENMKMWITDFVHYRTIMQGTVGTDLELATQFIAERHASKSITREMIQEYLSKNSVFTKKQSWVQSISPF
jgi:hypothetical protein